MKRRRFPHWTRHPVNSHNNNAYEEAEASAIIQVKEKSRVSSFLLPLSLSIQAAGQIGTESTPPPKKLIFLKNI